jgi:hypothetical protein
VERVVVTLGCAGVVGGEEGEAATQLDGDETAETGKARIGERCTPTKELDLDNEKIDDGCELNWKRRTDARKLYGRRAWKESVRALAGILPLHSGQQPAATYLSVSDRHILRPSRGSLSLPTAPAQSSRRARLRPSIPLDPPTASSRPP